jgi:hypothetical protein
MGTEINDPSEIYDIVIANLFIKSLCLLALEK